MKHVGLNVAADPLFTAAYTGVSGALVAVVADDPGMASSQNEQDTRRLAVASGVPLLEPWDSQSAFDMMLLAVAVSERWKLPVILRLTTRVSHSKTIIRAQEAHLRVPRPHFERAIADRVMIPAHARPAHRRLRARLEDLAAWNDAEGPQHERPGDAGLSIIASGVAVMHAREAAPLARVLSIGMSHPLPLETIRRFASEAGRCIVIEEGDPHLVDAINAAGIGVEGKPSKFRFGELNVGRVRRIIAGDTSPEASRPPGKPPQLCTGCPHRVAFTALREMGCIVTGDIGCYSLGVLPPFEAIDTIVCMGASIGVGLGMRHTLPEEEARRVVSVIGDSTFIHSGITGIAEMVYNPPPTGHVVLILDNGTTAMTGLQEHPGTGRSLDHSGSGKIVIEEVCRALGVANVHVIDPVVDSAGFNELLKQGLDSGELCVIITRRTCLLAAGKIKVYDAANAAPACEVAHVD